LAKFLHSNVLWEEIRKRARASRRLALVVAYLGRHPEKLIHWPRDTLIVADLSELAVRRGTTSAKGALELVKRGVAVFHSDALHSKVFLFDRSAIVGSANLSQVSAETLEEAGVLLSSARELRQVRRYVRHIISRRAVRFDETILKRLARLEPKVRIFRRAGRRTRGLILSRRVWILDAWPDYEETSAERKVKRRLATKLGAEYGAGTHELEWLNACGSDLYRGVRFGDLFFELWARTPRSPYGRLRGPYRSYGAADLGKQFGRRRYALSADVFRRGDFRLTQNELTSLLRLLRDRRAPVAAALRPMRSPVLLSQRQRSHFEKFIIGVSRRRNQAKF